MQQRGGQQDGIKDERAQELADHHRCVGYRRRHQRFDRAACVIIGDRPHRQQRQREHQHARHPLEEHPHRRLVAGDERFTQKRPAGQQQEDKPDHIRDRGEEEGGQLALGDGRDGHRRAPAADLRPAD